MEELKDLLKGKQDAFLVRRKLPFFLGSNKILEHPKLTPADKITAYGLISFADNDSKLAFPKQETIAKRVCLSTRQVRRSLAVLLENGLIVVSKKWKMNQYELLF